MEESSLARSRGLDYPWLRFEPGSWYRNHTLYGIARLMRARDTIEIGIGQYVSGIYWLGHHAKQIGGVHTAIDISPQNISRARTVIEDFDLPVTLLAYDSKAVAWARRVSLCYVDGGHSYEQVCGDIKNFSRWICRNGLMIFDDYGKLHLQVTEAVDDMHDPDVFDMMVWPWCGWAIWRRK
jgi:hypothetical protein